VVSVLAVAIEEVYGPSMARVLNSLLNNWVVFLN